jgi:BASS family bile acid:Na+ symporter
MYTILLIISFICLTAVMFMLALGYRSEISIPLVAFFALLAIGVRGFETFRGFSYTIWIFAAVTIAMSYPQYFIAIGDFQMKQMIVPLLQVIMFGMGTAMSLHDFAGVVKMPKAVLIGICCQFTIMPLLGFTLSQVFAFPPEIAAGIVLIGCVPCGLASNVMSYLANANLALSITLTSVATLMAPFVTPFLMRLLAEQYVTVEVWSMMWDIIKMVILPIIGGLLFNKLLHGRAQWLDNAMPLVSMVGIALIISIITAAGRDSLLSIGLTLVFAVLTHNVLGYVLGYWSGRLIGLDERSCRTIAIEVGMQNGGLASALAMGIGKMATVGLAPAIFAPLMNITGSVLATWWRGKPIPDDQPELAIAQPEKVRPH